jgi:hypothetical protein
MDMVAKELAAHFVREFQVPEGVKDMVRFDSYYLCHTVVRACRAKHFHTAVIHLHLVCFSYALLTHLSLKRHGAQAQCADVPATAPGRLARLLEGKAPWRDNYPRTGATVHRLKNTKSGNA